MRRLLLPVTSVLAAAALAGCPATPADPPAPGTGTPGAPAPATASATATPAAALAPPAPKPLPYGPGIVPPDAKAERCRGCHEATAETPAHRALVAAHPFEKYGCLSCHGGDPNAAEADAAHAKMAPFELLRGPLLGAACAGCHVAGGLPETRGVADGAMTFLELGCVACHRAGALAGGATGPALDLVGLTGSERVRALTRDPAAFNPATKMPAFVHRYDSPAQEEGLVAFLVSRRGGPGPKPIGAQRAPCASCHRKPEKGPAHRCTYVVARAKELSCERCHATALPPGEGECLLVAQHRPACGACHDVVTAAEVTDAK